MLLRLAGLVVFFAPNLFAQEPDSIIYAVGKIFDAETKQPVTAKITYSSLPYGNKVGIIDYASSYSFPMFGGSKYSILVETEGYKPSKFLLDPATRVEGQVLQDIALVRGGHHEHKAGHVIVLDNLIFQVSKSKIDEDSYPALDLVVMMMKQRPEMVIQLEGHTDYQGNPKQNLKLSKERVLAVKEYLVQNNIHRRRIKTKAYGGARPLSREDTPEAHRMNRRVELRILKN